MRPDPAEPVDVPVVDLADVVSDDPHRKDRAAHAARVGFATLGLVTVAGHDVPDDMLDVFHAGWTALTDRPESDKRRWHRPDLWCQRGWTPPNTERAVVAHGEPDFKECWFAAPHDGDPHAAACFPELYAPNVVDHGLEGFTGVLTGLGARQHTVGLALLTACERGLGLDDGALTETTGGAAHVTRALRYLPLDTADVARGVLWGEEHTDFNLLTVLGGGRFVGPDGRVCGPPDAGSGLYLRTRPTPQHPHGRLVPGRAPRGHLVAQVGQQLEILTGGALQATPHVIRAPATPGYGRTALAHFVHVHPLRTLAPLPAFATPDAIAAYRPPVLAGTYTIKTLVDIGLAPRSVLDGLGYRQYGRLEAARRG